MELTVEHSYLRLLCPKLERECLNIRLDMHTIQKAYIIFSMINLVKYIFPVFTLPPPVLFFPLPFFHNSIQYTETPYDVSSTNHVLVSCVCWTSTSNFSLFVSHPSSLEHGIGQLNLSTKHL